MGASQTAALNRGRHLCLAGRPSRWALAYISSLLYIYRGMQETQIFLNNTTMSLADGPLALKALDWPCTFAAHSACAQLPLWPIRPCLQLCTTLHVILVLCIYVLYQFFSLMQNNETTVYHWTLRQHTSLMMDQENNCQLQTHMAPQLRKMCCTHLQTHGHHLVSR